MRTLAPIVVVTITVVASIAVAQTVAPDLPAQEVPTSAPSVPPPPETVPPSVAPQASAPPSTVVPDLPPAAPTVPDKPSAPGIAPAPEVSPFDAEAVIAKYEGARCVLDERQRGALDSATTAGYQSTERSVMITCGGLGCVDDPESADPSVGKCAPAETADDCAGAAIPSAAGLCGRPHIPLPPATSLVPKRFMLTGMAALDAGIDLPDEPSWSVDVTAGFLFQLGLGSTRVRKLDDGGYLHENLPSWYFHLEGFGSKQRVGHDVGVVYRLRNDTLTRVGGAVFGQFWGPTKLWEHGDYSVGPSLHVELVHNLLLRGVLLLHGPEDGPTFTATATYAGALWDDFRKH